MPKYYPVYLKLAGRRCVVFGGGAVAEGKLSKLIESGARVTVVSPRVTPVINDLALTGTIQWTPRVYQDGDLEGAHLAIAATDDRQVNQQIAQEAELRGVILNVVDDPDLCGFIAPSVVERGPVTLAISTGGASPALARKLREALTDTPALEWADLAPVLSRARKELKHRGATVDAQRWRCCLTQSLLRMTQAGREEEAFETLLSGLLDQTTPSLCPDRTQCQPQQCLAAAADPVAQPAGTQPG